MNEVLEPIMFILAYPTVCDTLVSSTLKMEATRLPTYTSQKTVFFNSPYKQHFCYYSTKERFTLKFGYLVLTE